MRAPAPAPAVPGPSSSPSTLLPKSRIPGRPPSLQPRGRDSAAIPASARAGQPAPGAATVVTALLCSGPGPWGPGAPAPARVPRPSRPQGSPERPRAPQFPHRRAGHPAPPCMAPGGPRGSHSFLLRAAAPPSGPSARLFTRLPARSSVFVFLLLLRTRSLNLGHSLKNDPVPQSFKTHPPLRFPPAILIFLPPRSSQLLVFVVRLTLLHHSRKRSNPCTQAFPRVSFSPLGASLLI